MTLPAKSVQYNDLDHSQRTKFNKLDASDVIPIYKGYSQNPMDTCTALENNVCHGARMNLLGYILKKDSFPDPDLTIPLYHGYSSQYSDTCTTTDRNKCHGNPMKQIGKLTFVHMVGNTEPLYYTYSQNPIDSCTDVADMSCHGAQGHKKLLGYIFTQRWFDANFKTPCCLGKDVNEKTCGQYTAQSESCDEHMQRYCNFPENRDKDICSCYHVPQYMKPCHYSKCITDGYRNKAVEATMNNCGDYNVTICKQLIQTEAGRDIKFRDIDAVQQCSTIVNKEEYQLLEDSIINSTDDRNCRVFRIKDIEQFKESTNTDDAWIWNNPEKYVALGSYPFENQVSVITLTNGNRFYFRAYGETSDDAMSAGCNVTKKPTVPVAPTTQQPNVTDDPEVVRPPQQTTSVTDFESSSEKTINQGDNIWTPPQDEDNSTTGMIIIFIFFIIMFVVLYMIFGRSPSPTYYPPPTANPYFVPSQ